MIKTEIIQITTDFENEESPRRNDILWTTSSDGIQPVLFLCRKKDGRFQVRSLVWGTMLTDNLFENASNAGDHFLKKKTSDLFNSLDYVQQVEYTARTFLQKIEERFSEPKPRKPFRARVRIDND